MIYLFISIKYKYIILYFSMTIIPIIIIIILISQLGGAKLFENITESNADFLQLISNSSKLSEQITSRDDEEYFATIVKDVDLENRIFLVIDSESNIVFSTYGNDMNSQLFINRMKENDEKFKISIDNKDFFVSYHYDSHLNYYYILLTKDFQQNLFLIKELIFIIFIVLFISVFSIVLISFHLTRPIRKLAKEMKQKNITFPNHFIIKDELLEISIQLNKVFQELKQQIKRSYDLEMRTNKAQLLALQSQINPHFLHNALGTINSIAIIERVPLIAELSRSLSHLFRYNTSQEEYVSLKNEIEHIKNYLNVQLIRFDGMIRHEIHVEDDILTYKTVKFMLQPIVENSFEHAFKNMEEKGLLRIIGYKKDGRIIIDVEDNGVKMDQNEIKNLNERLLAMDQTDEHNYGIGLLNVHTRIKLAFGDEYGLLFKTRKPKGLCVTITLPMKEWGKNHVSNDDR